MKLLPFPDTRQATVFTCGAAAVQGIMGYYGVDCREDTLAGFLGTTTDEGTVPTRIPIFLRKHGLEVKSGKGGNLDQLIKWIDEGIPVIVLVQAWSEKPEPDYSRSGPQEDGHYVVLIGYDEDHLIFDDPSLFGNRGYMSREEFESRWHSEQGWDRFYVATWGKPRVFDPKKITHIAARRVASRWLRRVALGAA